MGELTELGVAAIRDGVKDGSFTAVEVAEAFNARVEKASALNAFLVTTPERAINAAEAVDKARADGGELGSMAGVPIGMKDLFCTDGVETTAASGILKGFHPPYESTVSANLWKAGAGMLGKLNMDQFAMGSSNETSAFGNVISPWRRNDGGNTDLSPGGSSGGSSAAVAARLCPAATGTDTGGSIRQPAAFTGITGIKPTYGRCSRWGIVAFASSLDQAGPMTKDVRDAAIVLQAMCGHDPKDSTSADLPVPDFEAMLTGDIRGLRVGVVRELFDTEELGLNPQLRQAVLTAAGLLGELGAEVKDVSLPLAAQCGYITRAMTHVERVSLHPDWLRERPQDYHHNTRVAFMTGNLLPAQAYYKALKLRDMVRQQVLDLLKDVDVLVQTILATDYGDRAALLLTTVADRGFSTVGGALCRGDCG